MTTNDSHHESGDDEPLDVEMSGGRGKPEGVAIVLDRAATLMEDMPDGTRYDFTLEIQEVETDG